MADIRDAKYRHIGLQLKAIRESLKMTADAVSKETGISRSYISDFERGFKLPTSKYLMYLHDTHNVNLNSVFLGEGRKFRPTPDERPPDFGTFQDEVDKMLHFMAEIPHALYAMLGAFTKYKLMNEEVIEKHFASKKAKKDE